MSLFATYDSIAHITQEIVFGTTMTFIPMVEQQNVNAPSVPDATRSTVVLVGILTEQNALSALPKNEDYREDHRPGVNANTITIDIDIVKYAIAPRRKDMFRLDDGRAYRISAVNTTDVNRAVCTVQYLDTSQN